jgi:hypothetical protein
MAAPFFALQPDCSVRFTSTLWCGPPNISGPGQSEGRHGLKACHYMYLYVIQGFIILLKFSLDKSQAEAVKS